MLCDEQRCKGMAKHSKGKAQRRRAKPREAKARQRRAWHRRGKASIGTKGYGEAKQGRAMEVHRIAKKRNGIAGQRGAREWLSCVMRGNGNAQIRRAPRRRSPGLLGMDCTAKATQGNATKGLAAAERGYEKQCRGKIRF